LAVSAFARQHHCIGAPVALIPGPLRGARRTLVILSLALAGCRGASPAISPTPEAFSLRLLADDGSAPVLRELINRYRPDNALIGWEIQTGGPAQLLALLEQAAAPFAIMTYEQSLAEAAERDGLWLTPVGQRGVAVIVHPDNPVQNLTLAQLQAVFAGRIDNWSALGGEDIPLTVVAPYEASADSALMQQLVLGNSRLTRTARLAATGRGMIDMVSAEVGAVGFISTAYLAETVRAVAVEGVLPTPAALSDGQYPIRAPVVFVGPSEPGDDAYRDFFVWVQSEAGQQTVGGRFGALSAGR
jgi:phosphate transport system substrate-binding protein